MNYHQAHEVPIRIVRIFNTYGPRMDPNDGRVISNFINQALQGQPLTIYGDGLQTRSFCYVDDLIEGFLKMMAQDETTGPVNLGNPVENSMFELAEAVLQTVNSNSQLEYRPLPTDDPKQRCPDITKARTILNWEPRVSLKDGLAKTVSYYENLKKQETS